MRLEEEWTGGKIVNEERYKSDSQNQRQKSNK